jgi:uncharacterized protein (UPF0332 family)
MSFNPLDFLNLATKLASGNEAENRSAVSRSYYSVFLQARENLAAAGLIKPTGSGRDHKIVIRALRSLNQATGSMADRLRRQRGRADYNLNATIGSQQAQNAVALAQTIWPRL